MISNVTGVAIQQTGAAGVAPFHRLLHLPRRYIYANQSHPYNQSAEIYSCKWPNIANLSKADQRFSNGQCHWQVRQRLL